MATMLQSAFSDGKFWFTISELIIITRSYHVEHPNVLESIVVGVGDGTSRELFR